MIASRTLSVLASQGNRNTASGCSMKEKLDEACDRLRKLIRNPFAVQRYLHRDEIVKKCWSDMTKGDKWKRKR